MKRRLVSEGRIVTDADGEAAVEVDVACSRCANPCATPSRPRRLPLSIARPGHGIGAGARAVELSVDARALNTAALGAFGPALAVLAGLAAVASQLSPAAVVLLGALGLPAALLLGALLAARATARLDLRTSVGHIAGSLKAGATVAAAPALAPAGSAAFRAAETANSIRN